MSDKTKFIIYKVLNYVQSTVECPNTCSVVRALFWPSSTLNPLLIETYMEWFCKSFPIKESL